MKTALTIAGSDCSGGAGIQADIKTMCANGVYAMSAITALTAQNTIGVQSIFEVPPAFLESQLDSIFSDIFPDAVKIGMVSQKQIVDVIATKLTEYKAKNIVVDPVMISTSGCQLISEDAVEAMKSELFCIATVLTPNIFEAEKLSGMKIANDSQMEKASRCIFEQFGCAVLLKGGHRLNDADDFLFTGSVSHWFCENKIDNKNTHGTGCTLSSAIASNLAKGFDLETAIQKAKIYVSDALLAMLDLGKGNGPMNHAFSYREIP